jgi:hypothetical protein
MGYIFAAGLTLLSAKAPRVLLALITILLVSAYVVAQVQLQHVREKMEQEHLHRQPATKRLAHGKE